MVLAALLGMAVVNSNVTTNRDVLSPIGYGVRMFDGVLKQQVDDSKQFYLRIPNDDLLLGFRRRAGLAAPGQELGGWYSDDVFHIFGQILSGLARLYAATGDPGCREKAKALLEGWEKTISPDGYFYYSNKPNAPHYIFDKMVGGLVDLDIYAQLDTRQDLARITDWAIAHLDRSHKWLDGGEWYTLSENLYRAYALTGEPKYLKFAKEWEYTTYWSAYAEKRDLFARQPDGNLTTRYHAYSHVNTLGGAAWAYRVSGEAHYLSTIKNAYDYLQANQMFATGGFGPDESLLPPAQLTSRLESTDATYETQCGSWAIFKLCKSLIALTGDARYGDWVEQACYNGVAATIPESSDGKVLYYSSYDPNGAVKRNHWDGWSCCAGTRPMAAADIDDLIYFQSPEGIYVNLFVPSSLTVQRGKSRVTLTQRTGFPNERETLIQVTATRPSEFTIRFRRPQWMTTIPTAWLNGKFIKLHEDGKHWLWVRRTWTNGDSIGISLPMRARAVPLRAGSAYPAAVAIGPVVLAFRTTGGSPTADVDVTQLDRDLVAIQGEPLNYRLAPHPGVLARPFYEFKEGEEYFMYLDPVAVGHVPYRRMLRQGHWNNGGRFTWTNEEGASIEGKFSGDSVSLVGWAFDDAGMATVTVDGRLIDKIDQYGAGRDLPWSWRRTGFGHGEHTLRLTVLHQHQSSSKDSYVNVGGLDFSAASSGAPGNH